MSKNFTTVSVLGIFFLGLPLGAVGGVSISNVELVDSADGLNLLVSGSGFGSRGYSVAPVLLDQAENAYEHGRINEYQKSFSDRQEILRIKEDPKTLWVKPSMGDGGVANPPLLVKTRPGRVKSSESHYLMDGANSFLGWPAAYGGVDTPIDQERTYVAWYIKPKYDPRWYWSTTPSGQVGSFEPNETITVNGIEGQYIGTSDAGISEGMLQFSLPGQRNTSNLLGQKIVGVSSGAVTTFNPDISKSLGPGHNKYLRIWEDPSGIEGLRLSWTNFQLHQSGMDGGEEWYLADIEPQEWNFMEVFLDGHQGTVEARVNGRLEFSASFGDDKNLEGLLSPTIALLGFNGKTQVHQTVEIDDIYMDHRFSRIVIGASSKFSELSGYDLQVPIEWSPTKISAIVNMGAMSLAEDSYVYIVNEQGEVNENGYRICLGCPSYPSSLTVQ
jgi:hypothetical protein